jgi:hypothetical protein
VLSGRLDHILRKEAESYNDGSCSECFADKQPGYGGAGGAGGQDPLDALGESIPGEPGEDYPILGSVPDTSFECFGQVEGGYYADPEGECQVFHICAGGGEGILIKYSFLCPNDQVQLPLS